MLRLLAACVLLAPCACYRSHELGEVVPGTDAGPSTCMRGETTTVSFFPPRPGGVYSVTLTGVDGDPTADTLTFHLDDLPVTTGTHYDLVLHHVGPLASGLPFAGPLNGELDWSDGQVHLLVADHCIECASSIELYAGALPPFVSPVSSLRVSWGPVECADTCHDYDGVHVEGLGDTLDCATGVATRGEHVSVYVASRGENPCVRCPCTLVDIPASGLVYAAVLAPPR